MSTSSFFASGTTKRRLSSLTLAVFLGHIFSPFFAYAMSGDPVWNENILSTEASAIVQLNSVALPRTLVMGDTITLGLSIGGVPVSPAPSASFSIDEDTTLNNLVMSIDNAATGSISSSIQVIGGTKNIVINSSIPGVIVGTLSIDRNLAERNIRDAITAVAQQALISLPQEFFPGDQIVLTLAWSGALGGTGITQSYSISSASTRSALVSQIDALSFVSATMSGTTDLVITSETAGAPFSLSNVSVISSSLVAAPVTANIPPQAQKEMYNLARPTYQNETLTADIAGFTLTGSSLVGLRDTIDAVLAGIVTSSLSGTDSLGVTAAVPGTPFAIGNLSITGGSAMVVPLIPNRVAVAQVDQLVLPRSLGAGDTVFATITVPSASLSKVFSASTLAVLSDDISADAQIGTYVSWAVSLNALTINSRIPGTAFTTSAAHIDSLIPSTSVNPNIPSVAQVDRISFPRSLVTGDNISLTINGNTVTASFSGSSDETLMTLAESISGATVGVGALFSGSDIIVSSTVPGQGFSISDTTLQNSRQATVLVAPVVPVKQKNSYAFSVPEFPGDIITLAVNSMTVTGSTLTEVINSINAQNLGVAASPSGQGMELLAYTGGMSFTATDLSLVSSDFTGATAPGSSEVRANATLDLVSIPTDTESLTVGNCVIVFNTGGLDDTDCSDNSASMDVTGPLSPILFSAALRGITGITYDDGMSGGVALVSGGTGTEVVFTRDSTQIGALNIPAAALGAFGTILANAPSTGIAQVDTLVLPRSLTEGDTLALSISGQLVSQNIGTSTGADFDNLISTLNLLENISASRTGDSITLTAKSSGIPFLLDFGRLTHISEGLLSVSNDIGRTEEQVLNFPAYISNGDVLSFGIDGTTFTGVFSNDVATTFASAIASSSLPGIIFSASGSNDLLIVSTLTGALFQVAPLSIASVFSPTTLTGNTVAGYQKDTLILGSDPVPGDEITVTVVGMSESGAFTRTFSGDLSTTMGLLTSDISSLTWTVSASLDSTSHILTLDAVTAGNGFSAVLSVGGTSIAPTTTTDNTGSLAQIDQIVLGRTIAVGDMLSLTVNSSPFTQGFATDSDTTMNNLATDIATSLSGIVDASFAGGILTLTSLADGTPFTTSSLTIATTAASTQLQPNIAPVAQRDFIDFERDPMPGDTFSLDFSGTINAVLTGSTLTDLVDNANLSLTGVAMLSLSGTHAIEIVSSVPGIPFVLSDPTRTNTPSSTELTANVVSVFPIREVDLPTATLGDVLTITIDNGSMFSATGSDAASLVASLNTSGIVTASLSGSIVSLLGNLDIPLNVSAANVTNSTVVALNQAFVPAVSRHVELVPTIMAPANGINSGWTVSVNFNGANFSYLTSSGDTTATVMDALYAQISLTGSLTASGQLLPFASGGILVSTGVSSTGATIGLPMIRAISETPGSGFTESYSINDVTAPMLSSTLTQIPQKLRTGQALSVTGSVSAAEPGSIYFVSSMLSITSPADITAAMAAGQAFLAMTDMAGNVTLPGSIIIPTLSLDGRYDIIAVDRSNNLSMGMVGWLTVDNTPPVLTISTPDNQTVNSDTFTLSGTTEANVSVSITLGTGTLNTTSLGDGSFSGTFSLEQNTGSVATVTATDSVGNTTTRTLSVTEDSGMPPLSFGVSSFITNLPDITLTGSTESGATVSVSGGSGLVSGIAAANGSFSLTVPLVLNANNILVVDVLNQALNTNSGSVNILQDNIAPTVVISTLAQTIHAPSIALNGVTENNSTLVVTDGSGNIVGTGSASSTGVWSVSSSLTADTANSLTVTATDAASNTGSYSVIITEDSTPNSLIISTPPQTINANSLTVTGSTKPNSTVDISGGAASATGTADGMGLYSFAVTLVQDANNALLVTSTDAVNNVSTGSVLIVEDSTDPTTAITTPAQVTYNPIITLSGTTEALSTVVITGGSGTTQTVADGFGAWTLPVSLNLSAVNTLVATATDLAGNTGTASVNITHDSLPIFLTLGIVNQTVHSGSFTFTGTTKSGATVTILSGTGNSVVTADFVGAFTGTVNLIADTANIVSVTAQDATLSTATGTFTITEDSTAPSIVFTTPSGTTTALASVALQGTTEAGASISMSNGAVVTIGTATLTGAFDITVPLNSDTLNTVNVTATDAVGNTATGSWTIIQDSLGPIVSNFAVSPSIVGPQMIAVYAFTTNENATGTLSVGTGANVLATLVATGTTSGTTHNSLVPGLLANTDYYYVLTTTDSAGNSTTSPIGVINSTDTVPPVIIDVTLSNLGTTGASLDFSFTEANFNTSFATGSITITTNTGVVIGNYPATFSSGAISLGATALSGLTSGTAYTYVIHLTDTFDNMSTATGTFMTPAIVSLTWGTVTQTGAVSLGSGGSWTTALLGTTITIISNPSDIDSLTGSLSLSWVTSIISWAGWNGVLLSPTLVASNLPEAATAPELSTLISGLNTPAATYSLGQIFQTVKVGAEGVSVTAVGGAFQVSFVVPTASVGQSMRIYRSTDGNSWQNNSPDTICILDAGKMCTFRTDHLSYFAVASVIATPVALIPSRSGSGGWGGGGIAKDRCPSGDYSSSYYDRICGTKPSSGSGAGVSAGGKSNIPLDPEVVQVVEGGGKIPTAKINAFVYSVQGKIYLQTSNNVVRIMRFTSIVRYLQKQAMLTSDPEKTRVYGILIDKFTAIIEVLREQMTQDITVTPNNKTNDVTDNTVSQEAPIYRYVNTESVLAVRAAPTFIGEIQGYLFYNERVEVLAFGKNWTKIKTNTLEGYVRTLLLRADDKESDRIASLIYRAVSSADRGIVAARKE